MRFDLLTHLYEMMRYLLSKGHLLSCNDSTDKLHQILPSHLDVTWLKILVLNLQEDRLPIVLLDAGDVGQISILLVFVFGLSSARTMSITALRSEQFKLWLS